MDSITPPPFMRTSPVRSLAMPEEFAGLAEIAKMLGVQKRSAQRYMAREDFPTPIGTLEAGRIWRRADVEAWAKAHLPLKRGPAPSTRR